jgi:hypothetical protein
LNVRPLFGDLDGFDQEGIVGAGARKAFWPCDCASSHEGCERNNRSETKEARGRKRSLRSGLESRLRHADDANGKAAAGIAGRLGLEVIGLFMDDQAAADRSWKVTATRSWKVTATKSGESR